MRGGVRGLGRAVVRESGLAAMGLRLVPADVVMVASACRDERIASGSTSYRVRHMLDLIESPLSAFSQHASTAFERDFMDELRRYGKRNTVLGSLLGRRDYMLALRRRAERLKRRKR